MASDTHVIVTAHNEALHIGATLGALAVAFPGAQIWVVDDGSTDATTLLARKAGARVIRSERTIGKGAAATLAAKEALEDDARNASDARAYARARDRSRKSNTTHGAKDANDGDGEGVSAGSDDASDDRGATPGGDARRRALAEHEPIFLLCDGDLAASAGRLDALVDAVRGGEAEMTVAVFATRAGGGVGLAVGFARWAIRRRTGLEMRAPISGQRAMRASVLEDVLPFARGFGMEIGMTVDAARAGHRIAEVELDLAHRATGRTLSGFLHRGRQLVDFVRVYVARR
jgi:glycosyltransferase involved in cell wall biosynthesis